MALGEKRFWAQLSVGSGSLKSSRGQHWADLDYGLVPTTSLCGLELGNLPLLAVPEVPAGVVIPTLSTFKGQV